MLNLLNVENKSLAETIGSLLAGVKSGKGGEANGFSYSEEGNYS